MIKSDFDIKGKFYFERYISAHAIMISFEGVPAIYFNSLFGTSNDEAKYIITGNNRDVNRYRWNQKVILNNLKNSKSKQSIFYKSLTSLLSIKMRQKAFHPNASRTTLNMGSKIFSFKRTSIDEKQSIICISNLSSKNQTTKLNKNIINYKDLIDPKTEFKNKNLLTLKPFQTVWLKNN